jgi:DNA-binding transcriptional ArsR family regulator
VTSTDSDVLFRLLADPTRRLILDLLVERGPLTVSQLAAEFPDLVISGISKHLMSLRAANLVPQRVGATTDLSVGTGCVSRHFSPVDCEI